MGGANNFTHNLHILDALLFLVVCLSHLALQLHVTFEPRAYIYIYTYILLCAATCIFTTTLITNHPQSSFRVTRF